MTYTIAYVIFLRFLPNQPNSVRKKLFLSV